MIEYSLWPIFIVNIGMNSLLSFFTLTLLIFGALKILRIKSHRLQAFCLMIPFIKLILDLGCYQFSNWALAHQINPLMSPENTRTLSMMLSLSSSFYPLCSIYFHLQQGQTFTLADLLCLHIGSQWTMICALGLCAGSLWFIGKAIWQSYLSHHWLRQLRSSSILYFPPLQNSLLQSKVQNKKVTIYLTQTSHSPFIVGLYHPSIFIPQMLFDQLTPEEFEAIIAHEIAHLQHGDLWINVALFWICHFFWWIPTKYFKTRLEIAQEYACDRINDTQIHRLHLAEALYKAAHWLHTSPLAFTQSFATSHHVVKRTQALLVEPTQESKIFQWIKLFFLMSWIITLFFGKFWTF
jgi:Zn-dependent protease with chaperone function